MRCPPALDSQVTLVGSYRTPRRVGTTLRFFLNDGTGELPCVVSTDMNARMAELWEQLQEHSHVRLFGKLKDDKSLTLFHAQAIQDHAEVVYHELDAIYHHFAATIPARRPPARVSCTPHTASSPSPARGHSRVSLSFAVLQAMFPLPTATAGAAAPPYGGTPSHYTVPHAPYNSFTHTSPQFGQGSMVRVGAGSLLQPGPAPSSSSPSAFQPSTSWALPSQASVRPGEVELRSAIRSAIRQSRDSHGASVQSIDQQLTRFNLTDIRCAHAVHA